MNVRPRRAEAELRGLGVKTKKRDRGPGGLRCPCCGPAYRDPRLHIRRLRHVIAQALRVEIADQMGGIGE